MSSSSSSSDHDEEGYVSAEDEDFAPDDKDFEEDPDDFATLVAEEDVPIEALLAKAKQPARVPGKAAVAPPAKLSVNQVFQKMQDDDAAFLQSKKLRQAKRRRVDQAETLWLRRLVNTAAPRVAAPPSFQALIRKSRRCNDVLDSLPALDVGRSDESVPPTAAAAPRSYTPTPADIARAASAKAAIAQTKAVFTEVVRYAGQSIKITRYANANAERSSLLGASSLDQVVANLDKQRAINTVEKTSRDWDDFKIREGIDDDLAQKAKDGYLERAEFLSRVDSRQVRPQAQAAPSQSKT